VAIRNRVNPGTGFQFFSWDAEHMVEGLTSNLLSENNDKCPSRIFQKMRENAEFRRMFADRIQKFCLNNGILTPSKASELWKMRSDQIDQAIIAESARWGDYRRDVHRWQTAGPFELYTKETHWIPQKDFLLNTWFPNRTNNFLDQLRAAGLFPNINGPVFLVDNDPDIQKNINPGSVLTMTCDNGTIYYTTNGNDPVVWTPLPSISPDAVQYSGPIELDKSSHYKARVFYNNEWSATTEQFFTIRSDFHDLKITEINYHPLDKIPGDDTEFEFVEIKNTGLSTLDIGGTRLSEGIDFTFPVETRIGPGCFVVIASNAKAFYERYGFLPFGEYDGQLNNRGENVSLISAEKDTLCRVSYEDRNGWPEAPDGNGKSLVPIDPNPVGDLNSQELWRESYTIGGSPGKDDDYVVPKGTPMKLVTVYPNFPNPFGEATKIRYTLHDNANVQIVILDFTGREIATIENNEKSAGYYENEWNGLNFDNGLYLYRIVVSDWKETNTFTAKIMLLK
jgi:hypothetical protein